MLSLQGGKGAGKGGEVGWKWGLGPTVMVCKALIRAPEPGELGLECILTGPLSSGSGVFIGGWDVPENQMTKCVSFPCPG